MPDISAMTQMEFTRCLEYTIMPEDSCRQWLETTVALIRKYPFGCFFVTANQIDEVHAEIGDFCRKNGIEIGISNSGLGVTNGTYGVRDKLRKAEYYLKHGATEMDMAINIAQLKNGEFDAYKKEISEVTKLCRDYGAPIKVLHEAGNLTEEEYRVSCRICIDCGVDYIKTCSGFPGNPRTNFRQCVVALEEIERAGMTCTKLKASSGVMENVYLFLQLGASRCGSNIALKTIEYLPLFQKRLFGVQ